MWLEAMVDGADQGLVVVAPDRQVIAVNSAAARLTRLRPDERLASDFPWSVVGQAGDSRRTVSVAHTTLDGVTLIITGKPLVNADGMLRAVVVTIQDVSELGRAIISRSESQSRSERDRRELRAVEARERHADSIVAEAAPMRAARDLAVKYAAVDSPVLLLGETGTGKGVLARLIHEGSARAGCPFIELNCGAIPESLIEAELFGYVRGAFTGADPRGKRGLLDLAHGGTVLLDEVGDLPLVLQVKLLRFLEDGQFWPVGAVRYSRPNVRVLAATNRDLEALIAAGAFRRDLYYRLNVLTLRLPPLRDRRDDIGRLVVLMLDRLTPRIGRRVVITPAAAAIIAARDLPGNVRELWNIIERLAVTTERDVIDADDLPPDLAPAPRATEEPRRLRAALDDVEAAILRETLARCGSQSRAAAQLGVSQATVARRAKRYGLSQWMRCPS